MSRGPGRLQRDIVNVLHDPTQVVAKTTTELAIELLGSDDRESIRRVRRAVDGLAERGLVNTWVSSAWDLDGQRQAFGWAYRKSDWLGWGTQCRGDDCEICRRHGPPETTTNRTDKPLHMRVAARKARMRFVSYAFDARPALERLGLVDQWISAARTRLADLETSDKPGGVAGALHESRIARTVERLAEHEARRLALLAELGEPERGKCTPQEARLHLGGADT